MKSESAKRPRVQRGLFSFLVPSMLLDDRKVIDVFRKIKCLREQIRQNCLSPDRPDLPVEEFQRVVSEMYSLEIKKHQVPFEGMFLRGIMMRYHNRVIIYIKKNMEEDWKRFAAVKEMCHVVNDEKEDWKTDGSETIRHLLAEYHINRDKLARPAVQSEALAEISAIELLYPYNERVSDLSKITDGSDLSMTKIAGFYKIPETIVSQALSEWYHDLASAIWGKVGF